MKTILGGPAFKTLLACAALCGLAFVAATAAPALTATSTVAPAKKSPAPIPKIEDPMLARVFPSIVRIEAIRLRPSDGRLTKQWTGGSGVIISPQGHVLTNCHVTEDGDFFRCYLFDGTHLEARLVGQDAMTDLAILQLDLAQRPKNAAPLAIGKFGDSDLLAAGHPVFALGSPAFLAQSVTSGIVSNPSLIMPEETTGKMLLRGEDVGMLVRWILHDARIFGGNSGGPLVDKNGDIVGINELGVAGLSGSIPGNLAHAVADQLIAQGRVIRGWSGLSVQARLESDGPGPGIIVADVEPGSPAARAAIQPGDLILACDQHPIEGAEEKAVAHFYRLETSRLPGNPFSIDYQRAGHPQTARLTLGQRPPAQADDIELRPWGAVVRDLTAQLLRDELLPAANGVWLENIRPAGPCGQAEPELRRQDVLIAVDSLPVTSVAELRQLTQKLLADAPGGVRTVIATFRRSGALLQSVVELRTVNDRNFTAQVRKAWLGAATQPLSPKLASRLGIKSEGGARITRIYPGTQAETAGLRVGDIILALDGTPVTARRPEDADVLARQIRQYKSGSSSTFTLWRDGAKTDLPVTLEIQPVPAAELAWWDDVPLEYAVRDVAFDDRIRLQFAPADTGVLVESVVASGWAALAGLRNDDLIQTAAGSPVATVAELRRARDEAARTNPTWWVLMVRRRGQTLFIEINLKPSKS